MLIFAQRGIQVQQNPGAEGAEVATLVKTTNGAEAATSGPPTRSVTIPGAA